MYIRDLSQTYNDEYFKNNALAAISFPVRNGEPIQIPKDITSVIKDSKDGLYALVSSDKEDITLPENEKWASGLYTSRVFLIEIKKFDVENVQNGWERIGSVVPAINLALGAYSYGDSLTSDYATVTLWNDGYDFMMSPASGYLARGIYSIDGGNLILHDESGDYIFEIGNEILTYQGGNGIGSDSWVKKGTVFKLYERLENFPPPAPVAVEMPEFNFTDDDFNPNYVPPVSVAPAIPAELENEVYRFISWNHYYNLIMSSNELKPEIDGSVNDFPVAYIIWRTYLIETGLGTKFDGEDYAWLIPAEMVKNMASTFYDLDGAAIDYGDRYINKDNPYYFNYPEAMSPNSIFCEIQLETLIANNGVCKFDVIFYDDPTVEIRKELRTFSYEFEQVLYKNKVICYRFINAKRVK